jgi:multiple sugar transport system permease protein
MAGSAMVTVPLLIVFFVCKKYILRGVSRSGIKG